MSDPTDQGGLSSGPEAGDARRPADQPAETPAQSPTDDAGRTAETSPQPTVAPGGEQAPAAPGGEQAPAAEQQAPRSDQQPTWTAPPQGWAVPWQPWSPTPPPPWSAPPADPGQQAWPGPQQQPQHAWPGAQQQQPQATPPQWPGWQPPQPPPSWPGAQQQPQQQQQPQPSWPGAQQQPPQPQQSWPGAQQQPPQGWGPPPAGGWAPPPQRPWGGTPPPYMPWQRPAPGRQPAAPRRRTWLPIVAMWVVLLAVGLFLGLGISHGFWLGHGSNNQSSGNSGANGLPFGNGNGSGSGSGSFPFGNGSSGSSGSTSMAPGSPSNVSQIAAKVSPALVDIHIVLAASGGEAEATGIVLNSSGLVLTNNHVVDGAGTITATDVGNGRTYTAKVLGYDPTQDVALIQLQNASGLTTATLGSSASLAVGAGVVGIGNAGGLGGTPSAAGGKVVALNQSITAEDSVTGETRHLTGLVQTNAAIEPGDSGGALVDSAGRVVGVDTAASGTFTFNAQNQGFAVPIGTAMAIATQIENGQSSATVHVGATGFLGVKLSTTPTQSGTGATVQGVLSGSPAAKAGIRKGDVITAVNGQTASSATGLTDLMTQYHPGDRVTITWTDKAGTQHVKAVTLTSGPAH